MSGLCIVRSVWFYQLDNENLQVIKNDFAVGLRADGSSFWEERQSARFATLMRIAEVYRLPPIEIQKRDRRGWVVLRRRQQHYMAIEGSEMKAAIVICGRIGSGKSTVSAMLASDLSIQVVSFGDYVRQMARRGGRPDTRSALQNFGRPACIDS